MSKLTRNVIAELLDILEVPNSQIAADKIVILSQRQAFINLINSLPKESKEKLLGQLEKGRNQNSDFLLEFFSKEQIGEALKKASETAFLNFYENFKKHLDSDKQNQVDEYLKKLTSG